MGQSNKTKICNFEIPNAQRLFFATNFMKDDVTTNAVFVDMKITFVTYLSRKLTNAHVYMRASRFDRSLVECLGLCEYLNIN